MKGFRSAALVLLFLAASACAQESYPGKPVRIIVGYSAGGGNDLIVRVMAPRLSEGLGQPIIIENKPGAQAIIACEYVAKASPDGYTLLMGPTGPMAMNPATYSKLPYSPQRDFAPISQIGEFPLIVAVGASLPVRSVKELIEYAKTNPTKVNYAASAAAFQIATELFKQKTGTDFVHIPYKGSGESVQAVIAGQVTMTIVDPPPVSGPLRAGTARGLAITSAQRHPSWPDLPTSPSRESTSKSGCGPPSSLPRARRRRSWRGCRRKSRASCACPMCAKAWPGWASIRSAAARRSSAASSRATSRDGPPSRAPRTSGTTSVS